MDEIAKSVILTQWGLVNIEANCAQQERLETFNHCKKRQAIHAAAAYGSTTRLSLPCFVPGKVSWAPCQAHGDKPRNRELQTQQRNQRATICRPQQSAWS